MKRRRIRLLVPLAACLALGASVPNLTACSDTDSPTGSACCRVCKSGKPCGDSCIARDKTCNKGGGCACAG
jgi:hypothetical protein